MMFTMKAALRSWWAWLVAELLRQASAPSWLMLWLLWSLALALLTLVSLDRAAVEALPAGQHLLGHAMQMAPQLLLILPLMLVPAVGVAAVAGRHERQRLEHLAVSGGSAASLLLGHCSATALLALTLCVPLLLITGLLNDLRPIPMGAVIAPVVVVWLLSVVANAIGLACGAWSRQQLGGTMLASGCLLLWWLGDMLAPMLGADPSQIPPWALAGALHHAAQGQLDMGWLVGQVVIVVISLLVAAAGMERGAVWLRRGRALAQVTFLAGALLLAAYLAQPWHLVAGQQWQLDNAVLAAAADLDDLQLTVLIDSGDGDASDRWAAEGFRHITRQLQQVQQAGAELTWIDRGVQPRRAAPWFSRLTLSSEEWQQSLLVVAAQGRERVIRAQDVVLAASDGTARMSHNAVLAVQLRELAGDLPRIAWYQGSGCRPTVATNPSQRQRLSGDWAQLTAAAGAQVVPISDLRQLAGQDWRAVVIPGPSRDLDPAEATALETYLHQGGRVLYAVDGRLPDVLPGWQELAMAWGISWTPGLLLSPSASVQGVTYDQLAARAVLAPSKLPHASQYGRGSRWPVARPLRLMATGSAVLITTPAGTQLVSSSAVGADAAAILVPQVMPQEVPLLAAVQHGEAGWAVAASVDAFTPASLADAANRAVVRDITAWLLARSPGQVQGVAIATTELVPETISRRLGLGLVVVLPLLALFLGLGLRWQRGRH